MGGLWDTSDKLWASDLSLNCKKEYDQNPLFSASVETSIPVFLEKSALLHFILRYSFGKIRHRVQMAPFCLMRLSSAASIIVLIHIGIMKL